MKKFYIYITDDTMSINVLGHEMFVEDGMLCCADPAMAMPCRVGDVFIASLDHDLYGSEEFDVSSASAPKNLNSLVAWMCGFSANRRCSAWRWRYNRHSFKTQTSHPTELRTLDERILPGKLSMAVVRNADATKPVIRLWAGIDVEPVTKEDVLGVADLFIPGVNLKWACIKLKEHGIDIGLTELRKARGLSCKESEEQ